MDEKIFQGFAVPRIKNFYQRHKNYFLMQAMDYEDVAQEIRIDLWQYEAKLHEAEQLPPKQYKKMLSSIIRNRLNGIYKEEVKQHLKKFTLHSLESLQSLELMELELPIEVIKFNQLLELAQMILAPEENRVLRQRYVEEMTHQEIADELKMDVGPETARKRVQRLELDAIKKIKSFLSKKADFYL